MRIQEVCPSCGLNSFDVLREMDLHDVFDVPENKLRRTNSYQRNYLLFRKILQPGTKSLTVTFCICKSCGFIFFTPRPDEADLAVKYDAIVATKESERREEYYELVDQRRRRAREIKKRLRPFILSPLAGNGLECNHSASSSKTVINRALDIGGADGHCLSGFVDSAGECAVLDFEERNMWPGVKRIGRTLSDLQMSDCFDLVLCNHTLEHVDDINCFLTNIKSHMNPNGLLYIEVPLGCSGEFLRTNNVLTHLNFFSCASLTILLEQNGFKVESCKASPVLSKKRYVEVITVVARNIYEANNCNITIENPYENTLKEMSSSLVKLWVYLANAHLVLSQPLNYARAFVGHRR
jgi:SAM-dependent methyltransferase